MPDWLLAVILVMIFCPVGWGIVFYQKIFRKKLVMNSQNEGGKMFIDNV